MAREEDFVRTAGIALGFAFGLGLALVLGLDAAVFDLAGDFLDPVVVDLDAAGFALGETDLAREVFALVDVEAAFAFVLGLAWGRFVLGEEEDTFGLDGGFSALLLVVLDESTDFTTILGLESISCLSILARTSSSSIVPYP